MNGIITMWHPARNYGFIRCGEIQYFFHVSNVVPGYAPIVGGPVSFELAQPIHLGQREQAVKIQNALVGVESGAVGGQ